MFLQQVLEPLPCQALPLPRQALQLLPPQTVQPFHMQTETLSLHALQGMPVQLLTLHPPLSFHPWTMHPC